MTFFAIMDCGRDTILYFRATVRDEINFDSLRGSQEPAIGDDSANNCGRSPSLDKKPAANRINIQLLRATACPSLRSQPRNAVGQVSTGEALDRNLNAHRMNISPYRSIVTSALRTQILDRREEYLLFRRMDL